MPRFPQFSPPTPRRPSMASEDEVAYHRTFLSPHYMDNFNSPSSYERLMRSAGEAEEIRLQDPEEFEKVRKALAQALKVPYRSGEVVTVPHDFVSDEEYR